jgi:hypothetical protein
MLDIGSASPTRLKFQLGLWNLAFILVTALARVTALPNKYDASMLNGTAYAASNASSNVSFDRFTNISLVKSVVGKTSLSTLSLVDRYHSFDLTLQFPLITNELVNLKHMLLSLNLMEVGDF